MGKRGFIWILGLLVLLLVAGLLTFFILDNPDNPPKPINQKECELDSDCVPASCCHPNSCVAKELAPSCDGAFCTMDCKIGTLDCGQGSCGCVDGRCTALFE